MLGTGAQKPEALTTPKAEVAGCKLTHVAVQWTELGSFGKAPHALIPEPSVQTQYSVS